MLSQHIMRAYDDELKFLSSGVAAMGGQAEQIVERAIQALITGDVGLAAKVIKDDLLLDEAQREIDEKATVIIAKRQPLAGDLRGIIGSIRITADLERVGDLGKNIAKRVGAVSKSPQPKAIFRGFEALSDLTLTQLKDVLDIFASGAVDRIASLRNRDEQIDQLYTSLFAQLLKMMAEDPETIFSGTHLLFCAKNLERIGDHATNIAETIYYTATGRQLPPERSKDDQSHDLIAERLLNEAKLQPVDKS